MRSVAMPVEHGGWGLTLEPGILGILVAPSLAGVLLGVAALLVFLVRTPLRLVLIGRRRGPQGRSAMGVARSRLATRVALVELAMLATAVVGTAWLAVDPLWWLPALAATPLLVLALWFDRRSRSRQLIPEVAGSVALASVAAMSALAAGSAWPLAIGLWLVLGARIVSSIPHVRAQVLRIHGQATPVLGTIVGDLAAVVAALVAVVLDQSLLAGAVAIVGLIVVQRVTLARPPRPAKVLGVRQMVLGFTVVGVTALGVWLL
jgi:hypothetical protein